MNRAPAGLGVEDVPQRPDTAPRNRRNRFAEALRGELPAEALSTKDRARLIGDLWLLGWTDVQIATHAQLTTYTTARIRSRIGLAPNVDDTGDVAPYPHAV